jgi:uncharacterized coiled-coil DUF342 family protein
MQSLSEDEKKQVLGTILADQLAAIQEAVKDVPEIKDQLNKLREDLVQVGSDLKVIKAAIVNITDQLNDHERRLSKFQTI